VKVGADDFIHTTGATAGDLNGLPREEVPPTTRPIVDNELALAVYEKMMAKGKTFEKHRDVAALVQAELVRRGSFHRTRDGRAYFFQRAERRLYDLEQRPFQHFLTTLAGLASTEAVFNFVHDILIATTMRGAREVEIHTLAHYDAATGALGVSDGGSGVWVRARGGEWCLTHNGDVGFFFTEPEATAWEPDFATGPEALRLYLRGFLLVEGGLGLHVADQQVLLLTWMLHQLFPALRRTRIVPAFLGPQGAGKTSGLRRIGRVFVGPGFEVANLREEKEDGFIAAVTNRTVLGLDNADTRVKWLEDAMATYATGVAYRLRRYYTTNDEVSYLPRAVLAIASRDPHFNRPDVAERVLPLCCGRPERYIDERALLDEIDRERGAIMGALLVQAAQVADALGEITAPPLPFRMADFASFGWVLAKLKSRERQWVELLGKLERAQAGFASEGDGLADALAILLKERDGGIEEMAVSDLFKACAAVAERERLPFPKTTETFGRRMTSSRRMLELDLGVRITEERRHGRVRYFSIRPVGSAR
jgi:hypothetical protein